MKKYFSLLSFLILSFYNSQQTEGLRIIKEKYAPEFENILAKYQNIQPKKLSKKAREELKLRKQKEINSLELKRNAEYLIELTKIQSNKPVINFDPKTFQPFDEKGEVYAKYPTGNEGFRQEVSEKFSAGNIDAQGKISTEVIFIIEKDGSITNVKATGSNIEFNRQAELAVYLTEHRWEPARIDGYPVRYKFRIPLNLNFD